MKVHVCRFGGGFLCALLSAALLLGGLAQALGEEAPAAPFCGSFDELVYLRTEPRPNAKTTAWVPAHTRLMLTPVSDRYAEAEYKGKKGYVFIGNVVVEDIADQPMERFVAYGQEAINLFSGPYAGAAVLAVLPPFTPLEMTGSNGAYWRTSVGDAAAYVFPKELLRLGPDAPVASYEACLTEPSVLLSYPLAGAAPVRVAGMGEKLTVTAESGGYLRVEGEKGAGYVPGEKVARPVQATDAMEFVCAAFATPLYALPDLASYTQEVLPAFGIVAVGPDRDGFSKLRDKDAYVRTNAVQRLKVKKMEPVLGCWKTDQPLLRHDGMPQGQMVSAGKIVEAAYGNEDAYLVKVGDAYGFLKKAGMEKLGGGRDEDSVAAITKIQTVLRATPAKDGAALPTQIPGGTQLWLGQLSGGFYLARYGDDIGYVDESDLRVLGPNVPQAPCEVYFDRETEMYGFPGAREPAKAVVNANSLGRAVAQNGAYLYVIHPGGEGYVAKGSAWTYDQVESGAVGSQKYVLFLNKATREFSVYYADPDGAKTDRVHQTETVAIGKRTTPTPSGTFALGAKERWHYFGPSYVPFAIAFTPGRYIHGPLYWSPDDGGLRQDLLGEFGTDTTGGCIRTPYDEMLWIYYHCTSENTTLEVVNGR